MKSNPKFCMNFCFEMLAEDKRLLFCQNLCIIDRNDEKKVQILMEFWEYGMLGVVVASSRHEKIPSLNWSSVKIHASKQNEESSNFDLSAKFVK